MAAAPRRPTVTLHALEGHERPREALGRAHSKNGLPAVLLLHGPKGVGKQRLALWTGQLILCERASGEPCGECRSCRMSLRLEHPDLLWYFPIKRPPSKGSRERDREAAEEVRSEIIARVRENALVPSYSEDPLGLHLATVRNLKKEASRGPAVGTRRVFVLAEAQELVSQEASPEAANALLKLLEEPPDSCRFVLTSSEPGRLLPTVESRTTSLHVPSLPEDDVARFLSRFTEASPEEIDKATKLSAGSIGRALGYLPDQDDPGPLERIRQDAFALLRAALSDHPADRFAAALSRPPSGARGLHELFQSLETWLRDLSALASYRDAPVLNLDARAWLLKTVESRSIDPFRPAECVTVVERARSLAAGNVNPQLILSWLLADLHDALASAGSLVPDEA